MVFAREAGRVFPQCVVPGAGAPVWNQFWASHAIDATLSLLRLIDGVEGERTLEDLAPTTRRVMGGAHPTTDGVESDLQNARDALHARETPPRGT